MAIIERKPEEQNPSQAPTLGMGTGTFGQQAQQRSNIAQGGSGRFTNLQQYIKANEANPNAQLLQREGTRRQEELGTKQQEFTRQAEPIKQQFEGIRSGQQFVQGALQNPNAIVQDPSQLQRFTQYRTQGIGDVETPFQQLQGMRGTLGAQQEQLASGLETIQRDPNALQNFIQSQRVNPALATRGENVLDRFLTQSTESGQKAIAGLGESANVIRGTQIPSVANEVESLRSQIQGKPLTSSDVQNVLTGVVRPEEEFLRSINPDFLQSKLGLNERTIDPRYTNLEVAQYRKETLNNYNQRLNDVNSEINTINNQIKESQNKIQQVNNTDFNQFEGRDRTEKEGQAREIASREQRNIQRLQNRLNIVQSDKNNLDRGLAQLDVSILPTLQQYESQLGLNRQQILEQYDPTRLSRIQALQQLTGETPFDPLLQTRLA